MFDMADPISRPFGCAVASGKTTSHTLEKYALGKDDSKDNLTYHSPGEVYSIECKPSGVVLAPSFKNVDE